VSGQADPPPPAGAPLPPPAPPTGPDPTSDGDLGFLDTAVGVVTAPVQTLRSVVNRQPVVWSLVLLAVINALTTAAQAASFSGQAAFGGPALGGGSFALSGPGAVLLGVFVGAPVGMAMTALFTAAVLLFARMLRGSGTYRSTFCGLAFATVPQVFTVIVSAAMVPLGFAGDLLGAVLAFGIGIWTVVLSVIAVRHAHRFTTGRAVAAVLLPIAVLVVVVILFVVIVVGALLMAL
jgi:hypothetical protein